jgi:hypothetical protein
MNCRFRDNREMYSVSSPVRACKETKLENVPAYYIGLFKYETFSSESYQNTSHTSQIEDIR